jgi:hypothetical protein
MTDLRNKSRATSRQYKTKKKQNHVTFFLVSSTELCRYSRGCTCGTCYGQGRTSTGVLQRNATQRNATQQSATSVLGYRFYYQFITSRRSHAVFSYYSLRPKISGGAKIKIYLWRRLLLII